jgi:hypothetical protein
VLVHLRGRVVDSEPAWKPEKAAMKGMYRAFSSRRAYERGQRAARLGSRPLVRRGRIERLPWPLSAWTSTRDFPEPPEETFREWWQRERGAGPPTNQSVRPFGGIGHERSNASPAEGGRAGGDDARDAILGAIRSALTDRPAPPEVPRAYRRHSDRSRGDVVATFAERVGEYQATVRVAAQAAVGEVLSELCRDDGAQRPDNGVLARDGQRRHGKLEVRHARWPVRSG